VIFICGLAGFGAFILRFCGFERIEYIQNILNNHKMILMSAALSHVVK
jgi:hypothetical protein